MASIGGIIMLIYSIILIIKAFKESIWWGLGYMFVPFVSLIFVFMHWQICKEPFLRMILAVVLYAVGFGLMTPTIMENAKQQQQQIEQQN